jgi:hypothetical protein
MFGMCATTVALILASWTRSGRRSQITGGHKILRLTECSVDISKGRLLDLATILVLSFVMLVALVLHIDDPQALTSNGVFKAVTIKRWLAEPANGVLDHSNYLYYPFMAVLCHALDLVSVFPGDPRHQLPLINSLFASLCLCVVYLLVRQITGSRAVAWAAALFHLASAFFLNLAISNEDILPSYTLLLVSMALASVWFVQPTTRRVAIVSIVFTLAWLFEWRLMFPTLPGLLLALVIGPGSVWARLSRVLLFLAVMIGVAEIAMLLWGPQNNNAGRVIDLLWTGKGIGEGWAGFSEVKVALLSAGISQYLVRGANIGTPSLVPLMWVEILSVSLFISAVAVLSIAILWRNRESPKARVLAAIFGITFAAGEALNLYSQPQDPQMQINVMSWLSIGWALCLAEGSRWRRLPVLGASTMATVALFIFNFSQMPPPGHDSAWRRSLERIERDTDLSRTIFLLQGFEQAVSEKFYQWDGDWDYFEKLGPAPALKPKFKLLAVVSGPVHRPKATGSELANELKSQIERAFDLGYDVLANSVWDANEALLADGLATIADTQKASSLYRMMHENFVGTLAFTDPIAGRYYRLTRKTKGP